MLKNLYSGIECPRYSVGIGDQYKKFHGELNEFYARLDPRYYQSWLERNSFIRKVLEHLDQVIDYFVGEYTLKNEGDIGDQFREIWPEFFRNFYFHHIYICYSDEIRKLEVEDWKKYPEQDFHRNCGDSKFRLFILASRNNQKIKRFTSIYSQLQYDIDTEKHPMIRASLNEGKMWLWWWEIAHNIKGGEDMVFQAIRLANKRLIREQSDPEKGRLEDEQFKTTDPVFSVDVSDHNANEYNILDVMPPDSPKIFLDTIQNWYRWRVGPLGYSENDNSTKEKLSGEVFQSMHGVTNAQRRILEALKVFAKRFQKLYPDVEPLEFIVSNWGDAQGLPQGPELPMSPERKYPNDEIDTPALEKLK